MRNAIFVIFLLIVIGVAAFVAYNAYFIVHQTQTALVLEFGNPKRVIDKEPGLYFKTPFIQTVEYLRQAHPRHRPAVEGSDRLRSEAAGGRCLCPLQDHQSAAVLPVGDQ